MPDEPAHAFPDEPANFPDERVGDERAQMNLPDERVGDERAQNIKFNLRDEPVHGSPGDEPAR